MFYDSVLLNGLCDCDCTKEDWRLERFGSAFVGNRYFTRINCDIITTVLTPHDNATVGNTVISLFAIVYCKSQQHNVGF